MIHLTAVEKRASFPQEARFPYNVPVIARLESIRFETAVTFLVGGFYYAPLASVSHAHNRC
jgi:predicted ATPase